MTLSLLAGNDYRYLINVFPTPGLYSKTRLLYRFRRSSHSSF